MSEVTSYHQVIIRIVSCPCPPSPGPRSCPPSVSAPRVSWTPPGPPGPLIRLLGRPTAICCHLRLSPASREASHPWDTGPGVPQSSESNQVTPCLMKSSLISCSLSLWIFSRLYSGLSPVTLLMAASRLCFPTVADNRKIFKILRKISALSLASYPTLGYRGLHWVSESCSHTHSTPSTIITENVTFLLGRIGWRTSPTLDTCLGKSILDSVTFH